MSNRNNRRTLLVIDDDKLFCEMVSRYFTDKRIKVFTAYTASEGLRINAEQDIDVVLLDQKLPDGRGVDFCKPLLKQNEAIKIIFNTAYPSFDNAVEAVKVGAYDYLSKPFELDELALAIDLALKTMDLEKVVQSHNYKIDKEKKKTVLIGKQGGLKEIQELIMLAASNDAHVLITGETGTGKGVVAKSIHYLSSAMYTVFMSTNCAALPEHLIEAELFGSEKGAYTGADVLRKGIFELANGGTLFLDEIGTLPFQLQSKLLGVLDDKKVRRLGGNTLLPVDARIIAATNIDLDNAIQKKCFREDLYYRLCVMRIHIPPLRERLEDLPELCRYFINDFNIQADLEISNSELDALASYHWPGNVRELKNMIERSIILRDGTLLQPSKLIKQQKTGTENRFPNNSHQKKIETLKEMERKHIEYTLLQLSNNISQAARALGVSRSTLKRKLDNYGLLKPALK